MASSRRPEDRSFPESRRGPVQRGSGGAGVGPPHFVMHSQLGRRRPDTHQWLRAACWLCKSSVHGRPAHGRQSGVRAPGQLRYQRLLALFTCTWAEPPPPPPAVGGCNPHRRQIRQSPLGGYDTPHPWRFPDRACTVIRLKQERGVPRRCRRQRRPARPRPRRGALGLTVWAGPAGGPRPAGEGGGERRGARLRFVSGRGRRRRRSCGQEHGVDDVDDAVVGHDVGGEDRGAADRDAVGVGGLDGEALALHGRRRREAQDVLR